MTTTEHSYEHVTITRDEGIAEVHLHTNGGPMIWGPQAHNDTRDAFTELADDTSLKVVILTGEGPVYCTEMDSEAFVSSGDPWSVIWYDVRRILQRLADIDVPVIGVLNGPAHIHAEFVFLSDIVLAADTASVAEHAHFMVGAVPGDGSQIIFPYVLGPQRAKHVLITGEIIDAAELLRIGAVNEVLPADEVLDRARQLARDLAEKPATLLRYTRAVLADPLRRLLAEGLSHGLALEGAALPETYEGQA